MADARPDLQLVNEQNLQALLEERNRMTRGPEPPDNGGMEARVAKLEEFAQEARDRLVRIEAAMSTKDDVSQLEVRVAKAMHDQTWKIVGAMLTFGTLLSGAVFFIAKNVH